MDSKLLFSSASYAWGLRGICRLHRIPFAPHVVLQQVPPPYTLLSFQQAAEAIGLKSAARAVPIDQLAFLPLPCLAVLKARATARVQDDAATLDPGNHGQKFCTLAIVLRCDAEYVLHLVEGEQKPSVVSLKTFQQVYAGTVLLFLLRPEPSVDHEEALKSAQPFGFRWFVPELLKHWKVWRDVLLASLAIQLMALATPVFTQVVIDKVIVHHTVNTLIAIAIGLFMFMTFTAGISWVRQYLVLHTGNRIDAVVGLRVFEHLFKLPLRYFEHRPTGTLVARVQGVETIRQFLSGSAVTLILDVPFLFICLAIMFYYSWMLTLITLGILCLIVAMSIAVTPLLRARINRQFLLGARNQAFLTEYVAGMETVKSLQMEPRLASRFGDYLASYLEAGFKTRQLSNTYNVAANTLEQFLTLSILCAGAWLVMTTTSMTIGMLVAFQMFANRLSGPLLRMVGLWQEFQQASIAVQRLGDVMNAPPEPYSVVPVREGTGHGRIEIRNLSFRYAENLPYLYRDFDLVIQPGHCLAIMGPSGSGKSTLAKLLQGFYLPSEGSIVIDGYDIAHLSANELRQHFGVVPQETRLFSGTIYDNLVHADPHATFDRVIRACKYAEIHDTIEQLPQGYQTEIGEQGVGLSGGQKQRIAIARALLKRPRILIFDEATTGLDAPTTEQFAKTVNRLKGKVTMLFIAHQFPKGLQTDGMITLGSAAGRTSVGGRERQDG